MRPTERLSELVRKKHQVLVQLRDIGIRQMELVNGGDISALLTLLGAKQQLIAGLQVLEQELTGYYTEDPERRLWASPQQRSECAREAGACNTLLEEIVGLERVGAEKMKLRRNEVAAQLQQAQAGTQVRSAYEANRRRAS